MESFIRNGSQITIDNFDSIAHLILNKTVLVVNKGQKSEKSFRICEIEFYLNNSDHPDLYTHSHEDQKQYGIWYFHRYNNGTYKNGTFKGVDIALGNSKTFCGILIRTIYDLKFGIMIEGPFKVVNYLLEEYLTVEKTITNIQQLTEGKNLNTLDNIRGLILQDLPEANENLIYQGRRVGLSNKYPEYKERKYRYLIYKDR